ncbi:hypothetical protein DIPPA_10627 [Diplonema papillatum]|nr:hypothetical protein DIPPA_10627 [Diplonema papillatum]KAJ9454344.1 hypothetical protein DIPPA_10627 [Diplonema papillatum]
MSAVHQPLGEESDRRPWVKRASERMKRTVSEFAGHVQRLRLQLAFLLVLPSFVALTLCYFAGLEVWWTIKLIVQLALISCSFAFFYDTVSQFTERMYRKAHGHPLPAWDIWRTIRYAGVHLVYNGPYHMPKLLFLNWMYPGAPDATIAFYKWMWATFVFSPGESFGVLAGVQVMRDGGSVMNVCSKLRADGLQFQMTKWIGHAIPHYLSFYASNDVITMYVYNFGFKFIFELILAFLAARPVRSKVGRHLYDGVQDYKPLLDPRINPDDIEEPRGKTATYSTNYGSV